MNSNIRRRGIVAAVTAFVTVAALAGCASGGSTPKATNNASNLETIIPGTLTVAVTGASKPYVYLNASGSKWIGFEPDLVNYAAKVAGIKKVVFVEQDFSSLLADVANRKYDIGAACIGRTPVREKLVNYVSDYNNGYLVFIAKSGSGISSASDLSGKRVGVVTGTVEETYLQTKAPSATIVDFPDNNSAVQSLLSGSIATVFLDTGTALNYTTQYPQITDAFKVQSTAPCAWPISKQDPKLTAALNKGIAAAIASGYVEKITKKWLPGTPIFPQYEPKK